MGIHWGEQSIQIEAPVETVFEAITDYETFSEWQDAVREVEVLERDEQGRGAVVAFRVDAKLREVRYRLRYHYSEPLRIWWDFLEGDGVERIEGEYVLGRSVEGTVATYRVGLDPGIPVPGLITRRLNNGVMRRSVEDLRDEAERRAG